MAKSKNGGTRSFIKGRIGSDVYSVGKDGKGSRQQVVRSLAEQVSNPRTQSQMFGRMVMSTVMQAVSGLSAIIDHSFDGLPKGQPSISEFIRRNYALVAADAKAHPTAGNSFGLNKYQEKGIKAGAYVVSAGAAVLPTCVAIDSNYMKINMGTTGFTVGDVKTALGLSADGYLTAVCVGIKGVAYFVRVHVASTLSDSTVIAAGNIDQLFAFDGNTTASAALSTNSEKIEITLSIAAADEVGAAGVIVSEKSNGLWIHNNCVLGGVDSPTFASNDALPTYPTGAAQFLNGGEL